MADAVIEARCKNHRMLPFVGKQFLLGLPEQRTKIRNWILHDSTLVLVRCSTIARSASLAISHSGLWGILSQLRLNQTILALNIAVWIN